MSVALATIEGRYKAVSNMLTQYTDKIAKVIPSGSGLTALRAQQIVLAALTRESNRYVLEKCTPQSIVRSCAAAAEVGLELGSPHGEAYLVPFKGQCTMMIGYRGFVRLIRADQDVATVKGVLVREADVFEVDEGESRIVHKWAKGDLNDRGAITHAYAIVRYKSGAVQFEVMDRIELDRIRTTALSNSRGRPSPWNDHPEEMAKKCPIRRMAKVMNLSMLARRGREIDDEEHLRRGDMSAFIAKGGSFETGRVQELTDMMSGKATDAQPVLDADFEEP